MIRSTLAAPALAAALVAGCATTDSDASHESRAASSSAATHDPGVHFAKPGFFVEEVDGRLWVFREDSEHLEEFRQYGEPAKSVTLIGIGPGGRSMRGAEKDVILAYLCAKDGYYTDVVDGRLWVFREDSEFLEEYLRVGEPAKSITLVGAGPNGMTIRGAERATVDAYLAD